MADINSELAEFDRLTQPAAPVASGAAMASTNEPRSAVEEFDQLTQSPRRGMGESLSFRPEHPDAEYMRQNLEPGVPLSIYEGAEGLTRLRLGLQRNKTDQLAILRGMHGEENVRLDKEGNFILRLHQDGKPRDVLVDERNMTGRDFLDIASEYPAFALSLASTKGIPASKILGNALRGALGYAAGGAATDAAARKAEGRPIDYSEIATSRGFGAVMDTAFGYGIGKSISGITGLGRMLRIAGSNLAETGPEAALREIASAQGRVADRTGVVMEPTLAEATGNPMLLRLESFLSNVPFARNLILKKWATQIENEKAVQAAFGEPPDAAELGGKLINLLSGETERAKAISGKASDIVRREATDVLSGPLEAIPGREITPYQFGSRMIRRGEAQLQSFKDRASEKFNAVRAQPDSQELLFDISPIKKEWESIKQAEMPGSAATGEPIKALAPSGVGPIIDAIGELPDRASYFYLVNLRNSIYDRIDSPEPISSKGTQLLKRLGAKITSQIAEQGEKVLNPTTRALLQDANQFYAKNVDTFYQKGIKELLKPTTEAGAIDPERVASQLLAGGKGSVTAYKTLESFFENPNAVKDMNRMLRDNILGRGTDQATGLIKLEDLSRTVSGMEPEIVQKVFGTAKDKLLKSVQTRQTALNQSTKTVKRGTQDAIEADALNKAIDAGEVDSKAVLTMLKSAEQFKNQYANSIRKAVTKNDMGVIEAAPETFVKEYLTNPGTLASDVKDVMQSIYRTGDADLISDVRRAYVNEIFKKSAKETKGDPTQMIARIKGSPIRELDPQKFALELEDEAVQKRLNLILGKEQFDALKDFATSISGRAQRDMAGIMTGAFAGGSMFHKLLQGLQGLPELLQYRAISWAITSPKVLGALKTGAAISPVSSDQAIKKLVLTPEFLRVIVDDSGSPEEARESASALQRWGSETRE